VSEESVRTIILDFARRYAVEKRRERYSSPGENCGRGGRLRRIGKC